MSIDAMKQALEALEFLALENFVELDKSLNVGPTHGRKAIIALRAAIEQAQEPLTEKRIEELYSFWIVDCQDIVGFARAIERAASTKEKNT